VPPKQVHGLEAEGGEGREATAKPCDEEQPNCRAQFVTVFRDPDEQSHHCAPKHIDRKRAQGKPVAGSMMEDEPAQLVSSN
jgi:hypothetical protein